MGIKGAQRVIGLTGNLASGKSTVAGILRDLGIPIIDADQVSREVTQKGKPALAQILVEFGPGLASSNGELDRRALRALVFADPFKRKKLEAILHPAIRDASQKHFERYFAQGHQLVVYEASLIVEAGRATDFDGILLVVSSLDNQSIRARARDPNLSAELADQMIAAQMPSREKRRHATWVISNDGSIDELREKVEAWLVAVTGKIGLGT